MMEVRRALLASLAIAEADTPTLIKEIERRAKFERDMDAKAFLKTKEARNGSRA